MAEARLVANVKTVVGTIVTARGDNEQELAASIEAAINSLHLIFMLEKAAKGEASTLAEAQAVATVVHAFEGTVVAPAPAVIAPQPVPVAPAIAQQFVAPAPVAPPQPAPAAPGNPAAPACSHGEMRLVPGGISKKTGKPYNAFWSCQWPVREEQCKAVS
jgi:hypothetical protein